MLVSTLKTSLLRNSREVMSALTQRMTQQKKLPLSWPKSSSSTIQVKSVMVTAQSSIATHPTLPVNSLKSNPRMTEELVKSLKRYINPYDILFF
jgi:hypothetical protein